MTAHSNTSGALHVTETLFTDAESYFEALRQHIEQARFQIDLEAYIYESEALGQNLASELGRAAKRGVKVRLLIDGVGVDSNFSVIAKQLVSSGVEVRVYRPLPWSLQFWNYAVSAQTGLAKLLHLLSAINKRNHRKTVLIDREHCFLGSINISQHHLKSTSGGSDWRDTAVHIERNDFKAIERAFDTSWNYTRRLAQRRLAKQAIKDTIKDSFLLNYTRALRRHSDRRLLRTLRSAKRRILITNAYFVPEKRVLNALARAAHRGVDVKIILPARSDVFFMPWVSAYFYGFLMHAGVQIYEYLPSMLHAKTMIIDDEWYTVGSSNLNHRSFRHDLEIDYLLQTRPARDALAESFEQDLHHCEEQTLSMLESAKGWRMRLGGLILLLFGRWL